MNDSAKKSFSPSDPNMLQTAMPDKYGECRNYDTLNLKSLWQSALLHCSVEGVKMRAWTRKIRRFLFFCSNHNESGTPVRGDSLEVIVSTMWSSLLSRKQKLIPRIQHPERVKLFTIQIEQLCNPPKPEIEQHVSLCNPHEGTNFIHIVMKKVRWCLLPRNVFFDTVHIPYGNVDIDGRVSKSLASFRIEDLLTYGGRVNDAKKLETTFCRERERSHELLELFLWKSESICSAGQDRETAMHDPRFFRVGEWHAKVTGGASRSHFCHKAARQHEEDTLHRLNFSVTPSDVL